VSQALQQFPDEVSSVIRVKTKCIPLGILNCSQDLLMIMTSLGIIENDDPQVPNIRMSDNSTKIIYLIVIT